jgi:hypothetical protein
MSRRISSTALRRNAIAAKVTEVYIAATKEGL